jgi:L-aspartate oxidase
MEFFQFHPTAIRLPNVPPFLISEAVRGEGGILRDVNSYAFMSDYAIDADLAPRDIVARSILNQMRKTDSSHVFLDVTHLPSRRIAARFPHIYRFCLDNGLDITRHPVPVAPAAHYFMGGVKVNSWGETNIRGLFAAGETACTGVHGANRLASNSLLEVVVFSKRIIEKSKNPDSPIEENDLIKTEYYSIKEHDIPGKIPSISLSNLQLLLWDKVGILRSGDKLMDAAKTLNAWQYSLPEPEDRSSYELQNLIINARLMTEAALLREESRGAHYRKDYPKPSSEWQKRIIFNSSYR